MVHGCGRVTSMNDFLATGKRRCAQGCSIWQRFRRHGTWYFHRQTGVTGESPQFVALHIFFFFIRERFDNR